MGVVVDTSALIAFERTDASFDRLLDELGSEVVVLPAIVLAQLLVGVRLMGSGAGGRPQEVGHRPASVARATRRFRT